MTDHRRHTEEYRTVKSTVERLSPTRVRINVEVPFDELKPDFDRAYKKIAQQVKVPGFRQGKVPPRIIEARLGRGVVLEEVVNGAVPAKYSEAVSAAETVTPLGRPDIEVTEIADGDKIAFTAEVDVRPEITLPALDSLAVSVDDVEVTDADVAEGLDNLRARFGTLTGIERPAAKDDFVLIDLSAAVDGVPVEEASTSGFSYQVGQGGLIDGIDEAIEGLSAGESATFPTTLVAGDFADQEAEVTVTVTAVKERQLPDADDEFAQLASEFDTLDELTADLRERLAKVKKMDQVTQARDEVLEALVQGTEVPLPESVLATEVDSRMHDAVHGFDHDEERFAAFLAEQGQTREEFDAEARADAEKSVRTRLVLDALADSEQVSVTDEELTERIVMQAQEYRMPPQEFVRRIQEAGQLGAIFADVRRTKALISAVRAATVTDASGATVDLSDVLGPDDEIADEQADDIVEVVEASADEDADESPAESADAADAAATADPGAADEAAAADGAAAEVDPDPRPTRTG
jgi:trigger factor